MEMTVRTEQNVMTAIFHHGRLIETILKKLLFTNGAKEVAAKNPNNRVFVLQSDLKYEIEDNGYSVTVFLFKGFVLTVKP